MTAAVLTPPATHDVLRSFLAIGLGFLAIAVLVGITTAVLRAFGPHDWHSAETGKSRPAMLVNLLGSALFAAVGGALTAFVAPSRQLLHALVLAIVLLIISAVAILENRGRYPAWYQIALIAFTAVAALGGGIWEVLYR